MACLLTVLAGCDDGDDDDGRPDFEIDPDWILEYDVLERWREILDGPLFSPWDDPGDDAGDYSFVRQIVPMLFGRKVRGYDELTVLVDLLREIGGDRAQFMTLLLRRDSPYHWEYVEHWSDTLVGILRIQRDGDKSMGSCFAESSPPRVPPGAANAPAIANCILNNDPTSDCSGGTPFNMWDVVRSSIVLDNLAPAYRGYLFAQQSFPIQGAEVTPLNEQDDVSESFHHVFAGRNLDCLGCHNTSSSVSGEFDINGNVSFWNRHHPIPGNFEIAVYGTPSGRENPREINQMFRSSISGGSVRPFGMSNCGTFQMAGSADTDSAYPPGYTPPDPYFTVPQDPEGSIWDVEAALHSGYDKLDAFGLRRSELIAPIGEDEDCTDHCAELPSPPAIPAPSTELDDLISDNCAICHGAGNVLDMSGDWEQAVVSQPAVGSRCTDFLYRVVPGDTAASCLAELVNNDEMPPGGGLSSGEKTTVNDWIDGLATGTGCDADAPSMCTAVIPNDNDAGFAYLVTTTIVNEVWQEVMGEKLIIPNYFPRHDSQRAIQQNLVESVFLPRDWSLKDLLIAILASEHFNLRAPDTTRESSAYMLTPQIKPFEVNDPRRPPEAEEGWTPGDPAPTPDTSHTSVHLSTEEGRQRHLNAMTDGVHRYSAEHLLNSVHRALGWPAARVAPSSGYPDTRLRKGIGQFFNDVEPGFVGVSFQSLILWEDTLGKCDNPGSEPDLIDSVVDAVESDPGAYTRRDLVVTLRDWLIANGTIQSAVPVDEAETEEALLNALFGGDDATNVLDDTLTVSTAAQRNALGDALRSYCGVLVETPQFLLAGLADETLGPKPALRACNDAICSYRELCEALEGPVENGLDVNLACSDDCLVVEEPPSRGPFFPPWEPFCPPSRCEHIPWGGFGPDPEDPFCLIRPDGCFPPKPPECNLGCALVDCCGGPLPPIDGKGYFLGNAHGAEILFAEGVRIIRSGETTPTVLEAGQILRHGDFLILPVGGQVRFADPAGTFQTPKGGVPRDADNGWHFLVTSRADRRARTAQMIGLPVKQGWIEQALTPEWKKAEMRGEKPVQFLMRPEDPARIEQREAALAEFENLKAQQPYEQGPESSDPKR